MDEEIQVVESRSPEGFGFYFKVRPTGRLYRFAPIRRPGQPRYWCFGIYRCAPGGMVDPIEPPWIDDSVLTREELPAATESVRANVGAWLAQETHAELRRWLLSSPDGGALSAAGNGTHRQSAPKRKAAAS